MFNLEPLIFYPRTVHLGDVSNVTRTSLGKDKLSGSTDDSKTYKWWPFGVNHYANELARGPSEGEGEEEGLGLQLCCLFEGNECSVPLLR